ncbi:MAG TPA: carboxypeptidase-like regulatory domain-containing protein, partial [Thermoanaerobaculia bacterium]|nr:carboxypeptidase-like regulatory domain-containing protein [Thermoanaerobaculia bacterium]
SPAAQDSGLPEARLPCRIDQAQLRCQGLAGLVDFKLRVRGFTPLYFWRQRVPPTGELQLGQLRLARGASLSGRVALETGAPAGAKCRVELEPYGGASAITPDDQRARGQLRQRQATNEDGHFQFRDLPPGTYQLTARQPGLAPARRYPVQVVAGAESALAQAMVLRALLDLTIETTPTTDARGRPWRVAVAEVDPGQRQLGRHLDSVGEGVVDPQGTFRRSGLAAGSYQVTILDGAGNRYLTEEVALESGNERHLLALEEVPVEGRVEFGKTALPARLTFGGWRGSTAIPAQSDPEGEFETILPHEGLWRVLVESERPALRRTLTKVEVRRERGARAARLSLRLPGTRLWGRALDESGRPLAGARLTLLELASAAPSWTTTDESGHFELLGLAPGAVQVDASYQGRDGQVRSAGPLLVTVAEEPPAPALELVLERKMKLQGQLLTPDGPMTGAPVIGLAWQPGQSWPTEMIQAVTQADGRFEMSLPARSVFVDLIGMPLGLDLTLERVQLGAGLPPPPVLLAPGSLGGTLTLSGLAPEQDGAGPAEFKPCLFTAQGQVLDSSLLRLWASLNATAPNEPGRLGLPHLPAGVYTACWRGLGDLSGGSLEPGSDPARCVSGQLQPLGRLELEFPALRPPASQPGS